MLTYSDLQTITYCLQLIRSNMYRDHIQMKGQLNRGCPHQALYDKLCAREQIEIVSRKHFSLVFPENREGRTLVRGDNLIQSTAATGAATSRTPTHTITKLIFKPTKATFNNKSWKKNKSIHTCPSVWRDTERYEVKVTEPYKHPGISMYIVWKEDTNWYNAYGTII